MNIWKAVQLAVSPRIPTVLVILHLPVLLGVLGG